MSFLWPRNSCDCPALLGKSCCLSSLMSTSSTTATRTTTTITTCSGEFLVAHQQASARPHVRVPWPGESALQSQRLGLRQKVVDKSHVTPRISAQPRGSSESSLCERLAGVVPRNASTTPHASCCCLRAAALALRVGPSGASPVACAQPSGVGHCPYCSITPTLQTCLTQYTAPN